MKKILLAASILLLVSSAAGLIAAEGHNPKKAAQDSDAVIHGVVSNIAESGEVAEHHPVQIDVIDAFKGNRTELLGKNLSNTVTVQVKGTEWIFLPQHSFLKGKKLW
jgi:ribulose kinase